MAPLLTAYTRTTAVYGSIFVEYGTGAIEISLIWECGNMQRLELGLHIKCHRRVGMSELNLAINRIYTVGESDLLPALQHAPSAVWRIKNFQIGH